MTNYFTFLCEIVGRVSDYDMLLRRLHRHEFYSLIPNDDNRALDGTKLREIFLDEGGHKAPSCLPNGPCTVLELMIGIAYRMENELADGENAKSAADCFWELVENLDLDWVNDDNYFDPGVVDEIDATILKFLDRKYDTNGKGGLFPLIDAKRDQRDVEIWYQMCEYLLYNYRFI